MGLNHPSGMNWGVVILIHSKLLKSLPVGKLTFVIFKNSRNWSVENEMVLVG